MKIFITGSNGFIGTHITKALVESGHEVVSFDLVQPRIMIEGVHYLTGTIMDKYTMRRSMKGCDAVFHLAAVLGVKNTEHRLLKCMNVNIQGTIDVIEAAVMSNISYFMFASSSEVLGEGVNGAFNEESPLNPKSGYAVAKLAGEMFVKGVHAEFGLPYNIVRFFNVYGPGQVAQFVIPRFVAACRKGHGPTVYNTGEQIRSFCHVSDASRAVLGLINHQQHHNHTFHIGNDKEPITMMELAHKVISLFDQNLPVHTIPFKDSDRSEVREIYRRVPDITKLRCALGYEPQVSLDQGLRELIESGDIMDNWEQALLY